MKRKIKFIINSITAGCLFFMLLNSCSKDENSPTMDTTAIIKITQSTAICKGCILNNGGSPISEKGFCWSTSHNPALTDGKIVVKSDSLNFTDTVTGLKPNVAYYVRSFAINSKGVAYGAEQSFTLWINIPGPNATDIDGNNYTSVRIGSQVWMVENLKTTKYRNGEPILNITNSTEWNRAGTGGFCYYDNNIANKNTYGCLYNWNAVADSCIIAPEGWHVATFSEWQTMIDFLGGIDSIANKIKETGNDHWLYQNQNSTNESGLTALPAGYRNYTGDFYFINRGMFFWTSTEEGNSAGSCFGHNGNDITVLSGQGKISGNSIRCIKDNDI
ncbi:MAG: fibrobacter succinogenes major paralogous domain-containing protein [Bacteroidales bacterium]|nr:fibrobacter succinogenes major paralogous domain-containing protein [Bacteroidales bacterium]